LDSVIFLAVLRMADRTEFAVLMLHVSTVHPTELVI